MKQNNKYLIVLGRGREGAGCTRLAIEHCNYLNSHDSYAKILAGADKRWGREDAHVGEFTNYSFAKQLDDALSMANEFTHILLMSVPAKNYDKECQDNFMKFIEAMHNQGKKIVYLQFDHKIHSINRNMYALPEYYSIFKFFDLILTYSPNGDFVKFCNKHNIEIKKLLTSQDDGIDCLNGTDFASLKAFWKPFSQKESKTIKFIGRSAAWKGPYMFRDVHEKVFKSHGYISTCEGIELSLGSLQFLFKELKPNRLLRDDTVLLHKKNEIQAVKDGTFNFERNHCIYMMPPYVRNEALERLSRCQFGIELLCLADNMLGDIIEMAMLEIIGVGCIPIFRKKWCQAFKVGGKPLADYAFNESGTIVLDEENPEDAVRIMDALAKNSVAYEKTRAIAYDFYSKHFSSDVVYDKLYKMIDNKLEEL